MTCLFVFFLKEIQARFNQGDKRTERQIQIRHRISTVQDEKRPEWYRKIAENI